MAAILVRVEIRLVGRLVGRLVTSCTFRELRTTGRMIAKEEASTKVTQNLTMPVQSNALSLLSNRNYQNEIEINEIKKNIEIIAK
jgi:hypothetical protein